MDYIMPPIPGCMPPIPPPPPPPPISSLDCGFSAISASVVRSRPATLDAFCIALLVTFAGSTIPASIMSQYSSLAASNPFAPFSSLTFPTTMDPSHPAFAAIPLKGSSSALLTMLTPAFSSSSAPWNPSTAFIALMRATPPPATIPSSTAALVALSASSTLAFFSFISASVAAPTPITATPPASLSHLPLYLFYPPLYLPLLPSPAYYRSIVLVYHYLLCPSKVLELCVLELHPGLFRYHLAPGEHRYVL